MANFQSTILSIAIIMLLLSLIFIGTSLKNAKGNQTWPPIIASCPDYWVDISDNGSACLNSKNLGKCALNTGGGQTNTMDFTAPQFVGTSGTCNKKKWAANCSIKKSPVTWDGITYGVSDPCAITTA